MILGPVTKECFMLLMWKLNLRRPKLYMWRNFVWQRSMPLRYKGQSLFEIYAHEEFSLIYRAYQQVITWLIQFREIGHNTACFGANNEEVEWYLLMYISLCHAILLNNYHAICCGDPSKRWVFERWILDQMLQCASFCHWHKIIKAFFASKRQLNW